MAAEIKYKIVGEPNFLRSVSYQGSLPDELKKFESKFKLAEQVSINFEVTVNLNSTNSSANILEVSEDRKNIKLKYIESRYHLGNGRVSDPPSPASFLKGFKNYFENTVIKEDNERFDGLNITQEEE